MEKKSQRWFESVSYPYDLHVFEQAGMIRVGIEYEDCLSVYEYFFIDFEVIKNQQRQHPIRLELEKNINEHKKRFLPHIQLSALEQVHPLWQARQNWPRTYMVRYGLCHMVVSPQKGSESRFFSKRRLLVCPLIITPSSHQAKKRRPMKGVLAHYPYPLQDAHYAPKLCVYIYGSVYESILSQLGGRHPDNAMKLHNDDQNPEFFTLDNLLSHPDQDPFGMTSQLDYFLAANVRYPILLVRYDVLNNLEALHKLEIVMSELAGVQYNFIFLFVENYKRKPSLESISNATLREQFVLRYSGLSEIFNSQPLIRLLMPTL